MPKASLYTLLPLSPLPPCLNHDSTTVVENCLFFFPFPVCGNDAICLHYGDDIISKSSLHLKMQKESQNWATKITGRTEARFQVKRLAAWQRQHTTEEKYAGLARQKDCVSEERSQEKCGNWGSFVHWKKVLFRVCFE